MVYTDPQDVPWSAYAAVAAIFGVIVAALLPWFVEAGTTESGLQYGAGNFTAGVCLAALGLLIAFEWGPIAQLGAALAGAVTIYVGYATWDEVASTAGSHHRPGVYLTVLAGALLLAIAAYSFVDRNHSTDPDDGLRDRPVE